MVQVCVELTAGKNHWAGLDTHFQCCSLAVQYVRRKKGINFLYVKICNRSVEEILHISNTHTNTQNKLS